MKYPTTLTALTMVFALLAAASAIAAPAPAALPAVDHGGVLADGRGMTLYVYKRDAIGISRCNDDCTKPWPPFEAAIGAKAAGDFAIIRRDDGRAQWAFKGQPLYRFAGDAAPGEANGDHAGAAWSILRSQPVEPQRLGSASDYAY